MVVECGALIEQVVGADDGGVAAGVAAADPALLEHRDVGEAVLAGGVVGRSQPVTPAADDERVIGGLGLGTAPLRRPAALAGQSPYQQRQAGEGLHRRSCWVRGCARIMLPASPGDEHPRAHRLERARQGRSGGGALRLMRSRNARGLALVMVRRSTSAEAKPDGSLSGCPWGS